MTCWHTTSLPSLTVRRQAWLWCSMTSNCICSIQVKLSCTTCLKNSRWAHNFAVLLICTISVDVLKLTWSLLTVTFLVQSQCMFKQAITGSCACIMPQQACPQYAVFRRCLLAAECSSLLYKFPGCPCLSQLVVACRPNNFYVQGGAGQVCSY